ncbi:MAG TPA: SurA N-terminal domain-containing protein [Candidatus Binatia bacterium]|nr:SurA N-terminal domain-containing protein [Candidatus Binatia bacterium]
MLKFMRRNAQAPWVRATFVAIVLVFIFWGIGAGVGVMGDRSDVVAKVNRDTISPARFRRTVDNLERMYRELYKQNMPPDLLKTLDLRSKAVDQLIRVTLLRQEAERLGLEVGDTELVESIQSVPAFQDGGIFTKERYLAVLRANNLQAGEFEEAQREELLIRKMEDVIGAGVQVSDAELREQYHFDNDKVNLAFARVKAADFTGQVQITDAEVQAYYDAHKEDFRVPERARIEALQYQPSAFEAKVTIDDAAVQAYYDDHREQYDKPEEVQARHILFNLSPAATEAEKSKARQQASEVLAKAKAGEDFAALAKQYSQDEGTKAKGGDLGFFKRGQMTQTFEDAAFALQPGSISELVESPFGIHIIKVEGKHAAETQTLEQVRPQIVDTLKKERAKDLVGEQARSDHDKALQGQSFADIGAASGLALITPPPFGRSDVIAGIGRQAQITDAAFAGTAGDVPDPVESATGSYLFRIVEKLPTRIPDLTEIRGDVEAAYRKNKSQELAKAKAESLIAPLKEQNDLAKVAGASGLTLDETGGFTRAGAYVPKLGSQPDLKKLAFQLTKEHPVVAGVYDASGDSVLVALKDTEPADDAKFEEQKSSLRQQTIERRRGMVSDQFVNYLKTKARIEINQDFLVADGGPLPRRRR